MLALVHQFLQEHKGTRSHIEHLVKHQRAVQTIHIKLYVATLHFTIVSRSEYSYVLITNCWFNSGVKC